MTAEQVAVTLKPCAHCGCKPCDVPQNSEKRARKGGDWLKYVWCENCGARGPERLTDEDAIESWNTRSHTTEADEVARLLREASGYVDGNHDEGCELDPEFGEQTLEHANDAALEADIDVDVREWPDDAVCTCGTNDLLARIRTALGDTQ